jgi:hypothetical protein
MTFSSATPPGSSDSPDQRASTRGRDRRREAWRTFRHAYPAFLKVVAAIFVILLATDGWLMARHFTYVGEIKRLRSGMTTAERQRSDLIVATEQDKLRMSLALARHQASLDPMLHLSVAVDSGHMYLERDGALLRDMRVTIAPERVPTANGDSTTVTTPRGQRTIIDVQTDSAPQLVLDGGTRIYASDDTVSPVSPGDIRVSLSDLNAVLPNISAGTNVYLY